MTWHPEGVATDVPAVAEAREAYKQAEKDALAMRARARIRLGHAQVGIQPGPPLRDPRSNRKNAAQEKQAHEDQDHHPGTHQPVSVAPSDRSLVSRPIIYARSLPAQKKPRSERTEAS